jgi:Zn-dependent protease with chaperone function
MPMTREQFDVLVRDVEQGVGRAPSKLRFRVAWLAIAGYAGLLSGLLGVLLISGLCFGFMFYADLEGRIMLAILGSAMLFGGGWAVLRVMLVRIEPPEGRTITRVDAPALFALLDELRQALRSVPFHRVLVVPECNAAVVQVPRLGVLGWPRNYLLLGLPLMEGLSADELRAVLAHEFAHLSKEHGRFGRWIYRLRRSWEKVFAQLSRPRVQGEISMRPLIVRYVDWFWPRFNAHAFVLSRANEYEADAVAARLAGAANIASSLFRLALFDRQLGDKFWPDLWQMANSQPEPPSGVFLRLRESVSATLPAEEAAQWVDQAFRVATTNADTHPCLKDRWRALGLLPDGVDARAIPPPPVPRPSAAEVFLGASLPSLRSEVEQLWRKDCATNWKERHERATSLNHRLSRLEEALPTTGQDVDGLWDKARVLLDLRDNTGADPLLRRILEVQPNHVPANFHLGRLLLDEDKPEGEQFLERAMAEDEQLVPQACGLLHQHYRQTGRADKIRELGARLDRHEKELEASQAELRSVTSTDPLAPHGLSQAELASVVATLETEPDLVAAELCRKALRYSRKQNLFVLCVRARRAWHRLPNRDREQQLIRRLSMKLKLPGRVLVIGPSGSFRALARKVRAVPDAAVFRRDY